MFDSVTGHCPKDDSPLTEGDRSLEAEDYPLTEGDRCLQAEHSTVSFCWRDIYACAQKQTGFLIFTLLLLHDLF
ncbi:hypothetical protein BaRGS_00032417 [Batillaria attramentaria]|uniref:Uncharacterized protein n=1 Tax=Batillaria attramentaria TaxID=370345 RepID=A0ABD0JNJ5_9CAEN